MTSSLEIAIVFAAWAIVVWRRPPLRRSLRESPLWMTFAALALALTVRIPQVSSFLEQATGVAQIGTLLKHCIGIIAMLSLINWATALTTKSADWVPLPFTAPRYVVAALSIVTMAGLFLAIPGRRPGDDYFITEHAGNAVATCYQLVFVAYVALAMAIATVLFARSARIAQGGLRTSLVLMAIGSATGIGYTILRTLYLVASQLKQPFPGGDSGFESASKWLKIITIAMVCAGTSYPAYAAAVRARRQWTALRALEPLWVLATRPVPHVVLVDMEEQPSRFDLRDTDFRLHRRIIEIRDAALVLRDIAPNGLWEAALAEAEASGLSGDEAHIAAEAMWWTTAAQRAADDEHGGGDETYRAHPADHTDEEAAWLTQVSGWLDRPIVRAFVAAPGAESHA
ncbi:hypothetical protein GCM10023205_78750 [Yinghuangia aomiensis]|uniref:DUF6545 domain-containing protein n=1 Tax=Yinghuangia aomiensis TaxID=676205 RepID=A0ABP9IC36_9ACTN